MLSLNRFRVGPTSPLVGVSDAAWWRLLDALEVQPMRAVSPSGGLGSFDLRPRRLVELGFAVHLRVVRAPSGRQVHACDLVSPWTEARFLSDPVTQYAVLRRSLMLYDRAITRGEVAVPDEISHAGALAVLHRGGRGALGAWPRLFESTRALYEAAQGAF